MIYLSKISISLLLFSLCLAISRAAISISIVIAIISIIYICIKKRNIISNKIKRLDRSFKFLYIFFFILLSITSLALLDFKGFTKVIKFFYYSLPFWLLYILVNVHFVGENIKKIIIICMLIVGGFSLYDFICLPTENRISGIYPGPNWAAVLLGLNIPFVIMFCIETLKNNYNIFLKIFSVLASVLSIFALIVTGSRGGIIGFITGTLTVIIVCNIYLKSNFKNVKNICFILLSLIIGLSCFFLNSTSSVIRPYDMSRIYLLEASYNMWYDHKIFGVGFENWAFYYQNDKTLPENVNRELDFPHNMIAYFFSTGGIIGGCTFLIFSIGIFISLLKNLKYNPNNIYIIAMIWAYVNFQIHGLFDAGILMKDGERLLFAWLGITYASIFENENRKIEYNELVDKNN